MRAAPKNTHQKIRTNLSLVRKSYGDVNMRILLAGNALRRGSATQTPPPIRRKVVRIFGSVLKPGRLGGLGGLLLAPYDSIVNEQTLPARVSQDPRCPRKTAILIACILSHRAGGFQVKKWATRREKQSKPRIAQIRTDTRLWTAAIHRRFARGVRDTLLGARPAGA
jgi:hypothetical protein